MIARPVLVAVAGAVAAVGAAQAADPIYDNLQPRRWYVISDNTLADIDPEDDPAVNPDYPGDAPWHAVEGQSAVINDWNGGALATDFGTLGGFIVWGGGHNGYFGNEVYVFDVATHLWQRLSDPTYPWTLDYAHGELAPNEPMSAHTYDYVDYHPATRSFIKLASTSNHVVGGGGAPTVHLFSLDTGTWRRGQDKPTMGGGGMTGASSAWDPARDVFWVLPAYNSAFSSYDPNANGGSGQWTEYQAYNIEIDANSDIDPSRDLFATLDARGTHDVIVHELSDPSAGGVTVTTTGDATLASTNKPGFAWDPVSKRFVGWAGGTSVYTLTPPAGDWRTEAWEWARVDPEPGNTVDPGAQNPNGTYSRWRYLPSLNAFIVVSDTTAPVYLYKLTPGVGIVFIDGFESGTATAWSWAIP